MVTGKPLLLVTIQRTRPQCSILVDPVRLLMAEIGEDLRGSIKSSFTGVIEMEAPESKTTGKI